MSALIIWASPNLDGLTAMAKDSVAKGMASVTEHVDTVHLNGLNIESCRVCGDGWGQCKSKGKCVLEDDFEELYEKMAAAKGIAWVTPVYWHDVPENLKSFLDRLRRCETRYNHYLKDKKNLLVACAGGSGNGAIKCLYNLEETLKHMEMKAVERVPVIQFNRDYMLPALVHAGEAFGKALDA